MLTHSTSALTVSCGCTDMPFQNRFCTYRQSREYIERHAPAFLSPDQIAAIMGGTAVRLLGLPPAR